MADTDFPAPREGMVLTVLLIVQDQERSRAFYRDVLGAKVVMERDPCILRFENSWIIPTWGAAVHESWLAALQLRYRERIVPISSEIDGLMAATAKVAGLTLVTRNATQRPGVGVRRAAPVSLTFQPRGGIRSPACGPCGTA